MRTPKNFCDEGLLEDEPFCSSFRAYSDASSSRSMTENIEQRLEEMAETLESSENNAAREWVHLAFTDEHSLSMVELDHITCLAFVTFYWKLYTDKRTNGKQAQQYLTRTRIERGLPTTFALTSKIRGSVQQNHEKKSRHLSHRAVIVGKKQALGGATPKESRTRHQRNNERIDHRSTKRGRHGFEGAPPKPGRLSTPPLSSSASTVISSHMPRRSTAPPVLRTLAILSRTPHPSSQRVIMPRATETGPALHSFDARHQSTSHLIPLASAEVSDIQVENMLVKPQPVPSRRQPLLGHSKSSIVCPTESSDLIHRSDGTNLTKSTLCGSVHQDAQLSLKNVSSFDVSPIVTNSSIYPISRNKDIRDLTPPLPVPANRPAKPGWTYSCQNDIGFSPRELVPMKNEHLYQNQSNHEVDGISRSKPPLPSYPPIWAQSRQEVCESFEWFRSYQGGVYHVQDYVKGYLLSAFASSRDLFENNGCLIISHGGGRAESVHSHQGRSMVQPAEDQLAQDKSVRALLTNYRQSRPLVLLIDDKYALFPYDLHEKRIAYAVLGFYTIAHAWAEYQPANNLQGRVVRYKFAFRWCEGQGDPWWLTCKDSVVKPITDSITNHSIPVQIKKENFSRKISSRSDDIYKTCLFCNERTPQVYQQGWACLNPTCDQFSVDSSGSYLPLQLDYNQSFLKASLVSLLPPDLRDIRPTPPESTQESVNTTYAFTRGLHCRKCGRLSCRFKWENWECMHCHATVGFAGKIRPAKEFLNEKLPDSFIGHHIHESSGIQRLTKLFSRGNDMGRVHSFILPDQKGQIHHIRSVALSSGGNVEADKIFQEYQQEASAGHLLFRRWPMRAHKCRGPLLTNYFSQNSGEPYQYVGGTENTVPFSRASTAVIKARDLIQHRILQALEIHSDFNEVLSAAYMERQRMAFHSDSERGLGPLVAGLSLGAPALMHFRIHHKFLSEDEFERNSIVLTIVLRHGDVLVMDGTGIQDNYEHTVIPTNFRIAATARRIEITPTVRESEDRNILCSVDPQRTIYMPHPRNK